MSIFILFSKLISLFLSSLSIPTFSFLLTISHYSLPPTCIIFSSHTLPTVHLLTLSNFIYRRFPRPLPVLLSLTLSHSPRVTLTHPLTRLHSCSHSPSLSLLSLTLSPSYSHSPPNQAIHLPTLQCNAKCRFKSPSHWCFFVRFYSLELLWRCLNLGY